MALKSNKVAGIPILPNLPTWLASTQGTVYHVKPYSGSDSNTGLREDDAIKTLGQAQSLATADQNDIVLLYAESNTAAKTTDYQSTTLTWAKDGVHLIGIGPGNVFGSRCRVAFISTYASASNLITVSADNCYIANIQFYAGVTDTNPTGCMSMTGSHNHVQNCHIAGMGATTNVISSAYSLSMTGSSENLFEDCVIGYTTHRGANATAEMYMAASGGSGTGCGKNVFKNCDFLCTGAGDGGLAITYAFVVDADPEGTILLSHCTSSGVTDWSNNCGFIWGQTEGAAATGGIGAVLTSS